MSLARFRLARILAPVTAAGRGAAALLPPPARQRWQAARLPLTGPPTRPASTGSRTGACWRRHRRVRSACAACAIPAATPAPGPP